MREAQGRVLPFLLAMVAVGMGVGLFVVFGDSGSLPMHVGTAAPVFVRADLEGSRVALEELRGKVVFVNFWATWCAPCRREAPSLERLYGQVRERGFEILAVSIDEPERRGDVDAFREEFGLSFPVLLDPRKEIFDAYRVTGVPETFMIDPRGRVVERFVGPRDWDDPIYVRAIERLLVEAEAGKRGSGG